VTDVPLGEITVRKDDPNRVQIITMALPAHGRILNFVGASMPNYRQSS